MTGILVEQRSAGLIPQWWIQQPLWQGQEMGHEMGSQTQPSLESLFFITTYWHHSYKMTDCCKMWCDVYAMCFSPTFPADVESGICICPALDNFVHCFCSIKLISFLWPCRIHPKLQTHPGMLVPKRQLWSRPENSIFLRINLILPQKKMLEVF